MKATKISYQNYFMLLILDIRIFPYAGSTVTVDRLIDFQKLIPDAQKKEVEIPKAVGTLAEEYLRLQEYLEKEIEKKESNTGVKINHLVDNTEELIKLLRSIKAVDSEFIQKMLERDATKNKLDAYAFRLEQILRG